MTRKATCWSLTLVLLLAGPAAAQSLASAVILPGCHDPDAPALDLLSMREYWNDVEGTYASLHAAEDGLAKSAGQTLFADRLTFTVGVSNKHTLEFVDGADAVLKTSGGPTYGLEYKVPIGAFFDQSDRAKAAKVDGLERGMGLAKTKADFYGLLYDFKLALKPGNELAAERQALRIAALSPSFARRCVSPDF